jgi:hypothetical protein
VERRGSHVVVRRTQIYAAVGIAAVVWAVLLLVQGVALKPAYLKPYSLVVAAVIICFEAFDRWVWRLGPIPEMVGCPNLRGTWEGSLKSTWVDPETRLPVEAIRAFLAIRQTYSGITTRLMTGESTSVSLVTSLDRQSGVTTLQWTYRNAPRLLLQERSRIHHGAVLLEAHGAPPRRLAGYYWTDRDTKGEMEFNARIPQIDSDFETAVGHSARP